MISGKGSITLLDVHRDLDELAPKFRDAVVAALEECALQRLDAWVYEAKRTDAVQQAYWALGRTVVPPLEPVTNAKDAVRSWHFYGLAVDVISRSKRWDATLEWMQQVADVFKQHECAWGGDWAHMKDLPHFQWGRCAVTPHEAPALYTEGGLEAVWKAVGAM